MVSIFQLYYCSLDRDVPPEVPSFIDTLFTALRTKSYLPYTTATPPASSPSPNQDTGIPIPLDALLSPSGSASPDRGRKRSNENDERDGRPPAKGPRLSTEGQFSRYSNGAGGDTRSTGGWGAPGDRNGRAGMNGHGQGGNVGMQGSGNMAGMNGYMGYTNGRRPQSYQPPDQKRGVCRDYHSAFYSTFSLSNSR
jgi:RNA-binding protein 26